MKLAARRSLSINHKLTKRELEVLGLMVANMRNKEIGAALSITEGTVKIHVHHILSKLGVKSRAAAVAKAMSRQNSKRRKISPRRTL
jgi:DNA-binding CsgD family transcriptional regulator